jgi:hypothetical protein
MNRRVFFFNMALRDQPYFPLYADDFLTDEKLNLCSAATQGVFIKMLCIFHKSEPYGGILFKQKDKQSESMSRNFALKLARLLPFDSETIEAAVIELLEEGVLSFENDFLFQKRMVKDFDISLKRSQAAKTGGGNPNLYKQTIKQGSKQKDKQNTEYENEDVIDNNSVIDINNKKVSKKQKNEIVEKSEQFIKYEDWANRNLPDLLKFKYPLTSEQLTKLIDEFGKDLVKDKLIAIGNTRDTKGRNAPKSVYLTCMTWCKMAIEKGWRPQNTEPSAIGQDVWSKNLNDLRKMRESRENNNLKLTQ